MKNAKYRSISAVILSVLLVLAAVMPGQSSTGVRSGGSETEQQTGSETESEPVAGTESSAAAVPSASDIQETLSAVGSALRKSYQTKVDITLETPLQDAISGALKNTDMSWLDSVSIEGASKGNDDNGLDASGTLYVNGKKLYTGRASLDLKEGKLYLCCPEFRKTPFYLDLAQAGSGAEKSAEKTAGSAADKASKKTGITQDDAQRLAEEAQEMFTSISADEWSSFAGRYAMTVLSNLDMSHHDNVTVTAGGLSEQVTNTTITIEPKAMSKIIASGAGSLSEDELILKILRSDFALDLGSLILQQTSDSQGKLAGNDIVSSYQKLLTSPDIEEVKMPGFSLTYASDSEGRLCDASFTVIYSGIQANLFSMHKIIVENRNAFELNLGSVFSALIAQKMNGDPDGRTGLLLQGQMLDGKLDETLTVSAAGVDIVSVKITGLDTEALQKGILEGTVSAEANGGVYTAEFTHPADGQEQIRGLYNDTLYLTISASAAQDDSAEVEKISRSKAVPVCGQSDWYAYVKDSTLSDMISDLSGVGVPDSIVESLSSGEAGTESSRENKVEKDGESPELQNGEVGGADIGNHAA